MRVPIYEQQGAPQAVGLPTYAAKAPSDAGLRAGIESAGRGVDALVAMAQREQQKAIVAESADAETDLTRGITDDLHGSASSAGGAAGGSVRTGELRPEDSPGARIPGAGGAGGTGFLSLQGRAADANAADFMQRIEKRRNDLAGGLSDDRARKLFLSRTAPLVEDAHRTIEVHAAQQRKVADVATLNARKQAALDAVRANPNNLTQVENQALALEAPIQSLSLSPEDAAADLKQWHGDIAATQIDAQLAAGDWQSAETTMKHMGALLNEKDRRTLAASLGRERGAREADSTSIAILKGATRPDGSVNQRTAQDALAKLSPEIREKAEPLLERRLTEAEQTYRAESERITTQATAAYAKAGWTSEWAAGIGEQLRVRNPERYLALRNQSRESFKRSQLDSRAAAAEQRRLNKLAMQDYLTRPLEERVQLDVSVEYTESGADQLGRGAIAVQQRKDKGALVKGVGDREGLFVKDAMADADGFLPKGGTKQQNASRRTAMAAAQAIARREFSDFVEKNQRAPTIGEAAELRSKLLIGLAPQTDEAADRAAEAILQQRPTTTAPPPAGGKFEVVGPGGARGMATEAWLAAHSDWRRK